MLANIVDPDQMPHYVASDLDLQFYWFPGNNGLIYKYACNHRRHTINVCNFKMQMY